MKKSEKNAYKLSKMELNFLNSNQKSWLIKDIRGPKCSQKENKKTKVLWSKNGPKLWMSKISKFKGIWKITIGFICKSSKYL